MRISGRARGTASHKEHQSLAIRRPHGIIVVRFIHRDFVSMTRVQQPYVGERSLLCDHGNLVSVRRQLRLMLAGLDGQRRLSRRRDPSTPVDCSRCPETLRENEKAVGRHAESYPAVRLSRQHSQPPGPAPPQTSKCPHRRPRHQASSMVQQVAAGILGMSVEAVRLEGDPSSDPIHTCGISGVPCGEARNACRPGENAASAESFRLDQLENRSCYSARGRTW